MKLSRVFTLLALSFLLAGSALAQDPRDNSWCDDPTGSPNGGGWRPAVGGPADLKGKGVLDIDGNPIEYIGACAPRWTSIPPSGWTYCAEENEFCSFTGTKEVRYGANGVYFTKILTNGVACSNDVFGDPLFGTGKRCEYRDAPPPSSVPAAPVVKIQ